MEVADMKRVGQREATLFENHVPEPRADLLWQFRSTEAARPPEPIPTHVPIPLVLGARFLIWKQDPTVVELGRRLSYVPGVVLDGPRDNRIDTSLPGTTPVVRTVTGDFVFNVGETPQADCAHSWAVVRQTLTMYERLLGGAPIPWAWNDAGNTDVLTVYPRAGVTPNAFYSRTQKALKFFYFTPTGSTAPVFTCRSLDIVSHEAGHSILDGLKPGWLGFGNPPQTGALHESFGDLTALFLALAQFDQVEAFVASTKANLHAKSFLASLAEQFGAAFGQTLGLRNADNDLKLSQVSNEVHALSQIFTGAIYDVLADVFAYESNRQRTTKDPTELLLESAQYMAKLLLKGIVDAPASGATFADVVNRMLTASAAQNDPAIYRTFIRNRFTLREVVVSPTPLTTLMTGDLYTREPSFLDGEDVLELEPVSRDHPSLVAAQNRSGSCGTMQLPEYYQAERSMDEQLEELRESGSSIQPEEIIAGLEAAFA